MKELIELSDQLRRFSMALDNGDDIGDIKDDLMDYCKELERIAQKVGRMSEPMTTVNDPQLEKDIRADRERDEAFREKAFLVILPGLMLRHNEQGYSDEAAISEAYRLADEAVRQRETKL